MKLNLEKIASSIEPVDQMDYRGLHIDFYNDDYGQQIYTIWQGKELSFGTYNTMYKEDMQYLIDDFLDTVHNFTEDKYFGARLKYFNNAGYRDIKLSYKQRMLKIFILSEDINIDIDTIVKESKNILDALIDSNELKN